MSLFFNDTHLALREASAASGNRKFGQKRLPGESEGFNLEAFRKLGLGTVASRLI